MYLGTDFSPLPALDGERAVKAKDSGVSLRVERIGMAKLVVRFSIADCPALPK